MQPLVGSLSPEHVICKWS